MSADVVCSCHTTVGARLYNPRQYVRRRAEEHDISVDTLLGKGRVRWLVGIRAQIAGELRSFGYSFPEIGKAMNRDHSTIIHLLRTS